MGQLHAVEQRHHNVQKKDVKLFRATDRQQRIPIIEQLQFYRQILLFCPSFHCMFCLPEKKIIVITNGYLQTIHLPSNPYTFIIRKGGGSRNQILLHFAP